MSIYIRESFWIKQQQQKKKKKKKKKQPPVSLCNSGRLPTLCPPVSGHRCHVLGVRTAGVPPGLEHACTHQACTLVPSQIHSLPLPLHLVS
ncbi:mCG144993 [Mus musculus]|nr:mCG144993 [Mus musculus]